MIAGMFAVSFTTDCQRLIDKFNYKYINIFYLYLILIWIEKYVNIKE